jgi:hypothetical protein
VRSSVAAINTRRAGNDRTAQVRHAEFIGGAGMPGGKGGVLKGTSQPGACSQTHRTSAPNGGGVQGT